MKLEPTEKSNKKPLHERLQKFCNQFSNPEYQELAKLIFACSISNELIEIYIGDATQKDIGLIDKLLAIFPKEDTLKDSILIKNTTQNINDISHNYSIISFVLPGYPMITSIDEMFSSLAIKEIKPLKESTYSKAQDRLTTIEFSDEAKKRMFQIVTELQTNPDIYFDRSKVFAFINFVKAIALFHEEKEVLPSDLVYMKYLWARQSDMEEFETIINTIITDYSAIADNFNARIYEYAQMVTSAKTAIANNKAINFYNNKINSNSTLDTLTAETISSVNAIKSEVEAMLDGKNISRPEFKPLTDLLVNIKKAVSEINASRSIRG